MATDSVAVAGDIGEVPPLTAPAPTPVVVSGKKPRATANLTHRASLTAVASLLDYGAKALASLLITPILVSGLGRAVYGMWEMLARMGSYMSATDGRPTEALRLIVAQRQSEGDIPVNRRYVGASLVVWALMLPVIFVAGGVLSIWIAPALTKAVAQMRPQVQITCGLIVLTFVLSSLAEVPESVLRGMNLGYRRMGLQSSLNILGGLAAAAAVWMGFGLVGLGGAQIVRAAATGLVYWLLVKKYVPWFKAARPRKAEVKALLGMSVWLALGDGVSKILLASDVLILGATIGPALVTTYALTSYAARSAIGIHVFTAGAAMPGLGGLIGRRELTRASQARRELQLLTWLFATVVGAAILLWNHAFVALWVGPQHYAGMWVDLLIVIAAAQTTFIRTDSYVIDATLQPRLRVIVGAVAAVLTITLCILLTRTWGLIGLSSGIIIGRLVQTVAYPIMVRRCLKIERAATGESHSLRLAAVTAALFAAAAAFGNRIMVNHWVFWVAGVLASVASVTVVALVLGTNGRERLVLQNRVKSLINRTRS
ncbi:MAG TPA: hypothetical protein VGI92_02740 [Gemmatimonadales bacterium]|jgi:O-antigen/teichoic acid export membrane protein